jgi:hypothetical protein
MREGKSETAAGFPPLRDGNVCIWAFLQMHEGCLLETSKATWIKELEKQN